MAKITKDQQTEHNKKEMIAALKKSLGIVTTAATACNISRSTHYSWVNTDSEYREAVNDVAERQKDFAESMLLTRIKEKSDSCLIFFLKTRCRDRGYIENPAVNINVADNITEVVINVKGRE